jgi:hypothetical protein
MCPLTRGSDISFVVAPEYLQLDLNLAARCQLPTPNLSNRGFAGPKDQLKKNNGQKSLDFFWFEQ